MMNELVLKAEAVGKCYGTFRALEGIDMELTPGIYGLLGPNGAGKSTMMNILSGLIEPSEGQVLFHGQEVMMMARAQCEVPSAPPTRERKRLETSVQVLDGEQSGLLDRLKAARNKLAQEENVPAYIVFSNATLADMAAKSPRSLEAFLEVSGVGRVKASKYGKYFLDVIEEYYGDRGR